MVLYSVYRRKDLGKLRSLFFFFSFLCGKEIKDYRHKPRSSTYGVEAAGDHTGIKRGKKKTVLENYQMSDRVE